MVVTHGNVTSVAHGFLNRSDVVHYSSHPLSLISNP